MEACDKDIGELSAVYDGESKNTFVSVYFNGKDKKFLRRREQAIRKVLDKEEYENFEKTMEKIRNYLEGNNGFNVAIFASAKHDFFKVVTLTIRPVNELIVDSSPYVRPLAELADTWKPFTLILLNSNHAKIYSVTCGDISIEDEISAEIMSKHKKGGWSQARFQRLRKGSIHSFFTELIEEMQKSASNNIILAGPGQAKHELRRIMPKNLQENIVSLIDTDIDDERELFKESMGVMAQKEIKSERDILESFKKEVLTDGLAVYGIDATKEAVRNGQVEILLVEKDYTLKGWICERCQIIGNDTANTCYNCGNNVSEVDVIEEIIELANRADTLVEFINGDEMKKYGHIAALLRYK
jgi:peptide chain release factor subunit 1